MPIPEKELAVVAQHLEQLTDPVKIDYFHQTRSALVIPVRTICMTCEEVKQILEQIVQLSNKITLHVYEFTDEPAVVSRRRVAGVPGIVIRGEVNRPLHFYGLPRGFFLGTLVQAIMNTSSSRYTPPMNISTTLKKLRKNIQLRIFGSAQHPPSAEAANVAYNVALASPKVEASVYEVDEFKELASQLRIRSIPCTIVGDTTKFSGVTTSSDLVDLLYSLQTTGNVTRDINPQISPDSSLSWRPPDSPQSPQSHPDQHLGKGQRTSGGIFLPKP